MTRFEMLQRFASDDRTEPRHVALFHAITESWNQKGRPGKFDADHEELSKLSRIKRTTYRKTLQQLVNWQYVSFHATDSRHVKSTLSFPSIMSESDKVKQVIMSGFDMINTCKQVIMSGIDTIKPCIVSDSDTVTKAIVSESDKVRPFIVSESDMVTLFYRVRIRHSNLDSSQPEPILTLRTPAQPISSRDNTTIINSNNSKEGKNPKECSVVGKRGTGEKTGKPQKSQKPTKVVGCTFACSTLASFEQFCAALADDQTAQAADLSYYFQRVATWRERDGSEPVRADWKATTVTFMLNDYKDGKLVTNQTKQSNVTSTRSNNPKNGRAVIEPPATRVFSW